MHRPLIAVLLVGVTTVLGCNLSDPLETCTSDDDCRDGEQCVQFGDTGAKACTSRDTAGGGGDASRDVGDGETDGSSEDGASDAADVTRDTGDARDVAEPADTTDSGDGVPPAAPSNVTATSGTSSEHVTVDWDEVSAANEYDVLRDGEVVGTVANPPYRDTGAAPPSISFGAVKASDGKFADRVALSVSGVSAEAGATSTYEVRARNGEGTSPLSEPAEGYRGAGDPSLQWQRSAGDSDADYSDIRGATSTSEEDTGLPGDGSWRYYRVRGELPDGTTATSDADRGRTLRKTPVAGDGSVLFEHDFSNGMPANFDHSANYPNSGTWGRVHNLGSPNSQGVFEPASIEGEHLVLDDDRCTSEGAAYPTNIARDLQNWELFYRVDAFPDDDGHSHRSIGGIGCVGCEPAGNYTDDRTELSRGRTGFVGFNSGNTNAFKVNGWDASGAEVTDKQPIGNEPITQGEWYVRIATSKRLVKTWVKYWKAGGSEPSGWTHAFDGIYLSGRPAFYIVTSCKASPRRANAYRFYELREIGL